MRKIAKTVNHSIASVGRQVNLSRPRVLEKLPLSARLTFGAFIALADGRNELQVPLRDLANYTGLSHTQVRRALKRLIAVRLIERVEAGHGGVPGVFRLRWRKSFPQAFGTSSLRKSSTEIPKSNPPVLANDSLNDQASLRGANPPENPPTPSPLSENLDLRVSEMGRRWFLGSLRRLLMDCGVPGAKRAELMLAFARALKLSLKAGRIKCGRDLGHVYRFICQHLDTDPEYCASKLARLEGGTRYAVMMRLFSDALDHLEHERKRDEVNQARLDRIREQRQDAKRESQGDPFGDLEWLKQTPPEFVDSYIRNFSAWRLDTIPRELIKAALHKIGLLLAFAPLNRTQRKTLKRLHRDFFNAAGLGNPHRGGQDAN